MTETAQQFRRALESVFGRLDWLPVADGHIHRFHVPGDRSGSAFFKIVVTVLLLSRLPHRQFRFRVQRRRSNRLAVPDGARPPA